MKYRQISRPSAFKRWSLLLYGIILTLLAIVYVIAKSEELLIALGILGAVIPMGVLYHHYKRRETISISKTITSFILENDLYEITYDGVRENYTFFPEVYIKTDETKNLLYVKFRLPGNKFNFRGLEQKLGDKLMKANLDVLEERGYIIYLFELVPEERLTISCKEELKDCHLSENEIALAPSLTWCFKSDPGFAVCGVSGSGKSTFAAMLMEKLTAKGCRVIYTDIKRDAKMERYARQNSMIEYAYEPEEMLKKIDEVIREMEARMREVDRMKIDPNFDFSFPPIFVVCDEIVLMQLTLETKTYEAIMKKLNAIIVSGRNRGVYVGLISQTSLSDFFGKSAFRTNLGLKVMLGQMTATEVGMLFGKENEKVKNLVHGKYGSGLVMVGTQAKPRQFVVPDIAEELLYK